MYITGKYLLGAMGGLDDVLMIRRKVFIEEQGISEDIELDGMDDQAIFAVAFEEGEDFKIPVASGRLLFLGEEFKIGRVCTLKEYRKKGYGDFVVRMLIDKAYTMGAKEIVVDAQLSAVNFYKKIGFTEVGEQFEEAGIPHQKMKVNPCNCKRACHQM